MALRDKKSLATLVRVRRRQEDLKAQAFAGQRRALETLMLERSTIAAEHRALLETTGEIIRDRFDPSEARRYYQYERYLARLGDDKDAEIRARETQAASVRADLEAAMKRRRMAEILEDRNLAAWQQEYRKREQLQLDEVASAYGLMARRAHDRRNPEEAVQS